MEIPKIQTLSNVTDFRRLLKHFESDTGFFSNILFVVEMIAVMEETGIP